MPNWILYTIIGKILIYLWMKFPFSEKIEKIKFIKELHECDLCSGVWFYSILAFVWKVHFLGIWFDFVYIPFIEELVTGCVTSYVVHLLSIGFREKHLNVVVV